MFLDCFRQYHQNIVRHHSYSLLFFFIFFKKLFVLFFPVFTFLRCDLEDLQQCHEHLIIIELLPGGGTSHDYYSKCNLLRDLLYCLDQLSFRLMRKLTSISSQQTMGRPPEELWAIAEYVRTLQSVALSTSTTHNKNLRKMSSLVNVSIQHFHSQVRWSTLICCCPHGRGCLGQRGFVHPIDLMSMLGVLCTSLWIVVSFLTQADGFQGLTMEDSLAIVLTCQIFSASFGIAFIAVVLRKSTKRWSRGRRVVILVSILMFALLFIVHVVLTILLTNEEDVEMKFQIGPISTLALFFTNIIPSVLVVTTWVLKFYFQYSQGNPVSITSYNPFDFLSRVKLLSLEGESGCGGSGGGGSSYVPPQGRRIEYGGYGAWRDDERMDRMREDGREDGSEDGNEEDREVGGGVVVGGRRNLTTAMELGSGENGFIQQHGPRRSAMLRQSSRFGAMSRFDSMEDDESSSPGSLMRRSLLREASEI